MKPTNPEWNKPEGHVKAYHRILKAITSRVLVHYKSLRRAGMHINNPTYSEPVDSYILKTTEDVIKRGTIGDVLDVYEHYMYDIKRIPHPHVIDRVIEWFYIEAKAYLQRKKWNRYS